MDGTESHLDTSRTPEESVIRVCHCALKLFFFNITRSTGYHVRLVYGHLHWPHAQTQMRLPEKSQDASTAAHTLHTHPIHTPRHSPLWGNSPVRHPRSPRLGIEPWAGSLATANATNWARARPHVSLNWKIEKIKQGNTVNLPTKYMKNQKEKRGNTHTMVWNFLSSLLVLIIILLCQQNCWYDTIFNVHKTPYETVLKLALRLHLDHLGLNFSLDKI